MCPPVTQRIKAEGRKIESGASTSFQTPDEKGERRQTAVDGDTVVEIVVLRAIYITEKDIPPVDEKSVKLEVAIDFKGGYTKKKRFSLEIQK
jgi:hypothetical protein